MPTFEFEGRPRSAERFGRSLSIAVGENFLYVFKAGLRPAPRKFRLPGRALAQAHGAPGRDLGRLPGEMTES